MIFSKACEYGIRATIYIAQQSSSDARASLKDIAQEIASPVAFTAKILQKLVKNGIIYSLKGANGGFKIDVKTMKEIMLMDIVIAIDGCLNDKMCVLGLKACSELNPCPVHHKYKFIKKDIIKMLKNTNVLQMSKSVKDGFSYLKI